MNKQKLIEALHKEKNIMQRKGIDVYDHVLAINYLSTGILSNLKILNRIDDYPITDSAMNDLETLYSDYVA